MPCKDGYRLWLLPDVAREEGAVEAPEAKLEREGLWCEPRESIATGRKTLHGSPTRPFGLGLTDHKNHGRYLPSFAKSPPDRGRHDYHSMFWTLMSPTGGCPPTGRIRQIIEADFGGFTSFREKFNKRGEKHFGSGWVWLVLNANTKSSASPTKPPPA